MLTKITKFSRVFHRNSSLRLHRNYPKLGNFRLVSSKVGKISKMEYINIKSILKRLSKKQIASWVTFKPTIGVTKKPNNSRLGKGKAKIGYFASNISIGMPVLELKGLNYIMVSKVLYKLQNSLSITCRKQYSNKWWF